MENAMKSSRRALLRNLALGLSLVPVTARVALAADAPLISEKDPAATAVQYVEDASHAQGAQSGAVCANCGLYNGAAGAAQGPCSLFPDKSVKAAGWCNKWVGF